MGKKRVIDSARTVIGESVLDAIVVVNRPKWSLIATAAVVIPITANWPLWSVALAGGAAGLVIAAFSHNCAIASTAERLVWLRCGTFRLSSLSVARNLTPNEIDTDDRVAAVTVDGQRYMVPLAARARLRAMLGI